MREEPLVPDQLPGFIRRSLEKDELQDVETFIDQLVAAGCQKCVIYFCLQQLSPASEWLRSGGFVKGVQLQRGEDLHDQKQVKRLEIGRASCRERV